MKEGRIQSIVECLASVQALRQNCDRDPSLGVRARAVKAYQQQRFRQAYGDLLRSPRFGPAARFFLDELYGPGDFSRRDAQFQRVVPALVRLFPERVATTVERLVELHALSERLDHDLARRLPDDSVRAETYWSSWQLLNRSELRWQQLELVLVLGAALDELTRSRMLRQSLHLMRRPAHAAGLGELQAFLERGFDTFSDLKGAGEFLDMVRRRESEFITAMGAVAVSFAAACARSSVLAALP